jgi:hypothetical protein
MLVASVWTAVWIWGMDRFDPKWGDRWNFWFSVQIFSMMGGVQAGVTFLGSAIYALIRKTIPHAARPAVFSCLAATAASRPRPRRSMRSIKRIFGCT